MVDVVYYSHPNVRARLLEFIGGRSLSEATAVFITAESGESHVRFEPRPAEELWECLDRGLDVGRSLWDRHGLIVDLDLEYVNFDFPGEPYLEPTRSFAIQQPVVRAIERFSCGTESTPCIC